MLRIGYNARLLQFPETRGWNRYAVELLAEMPAQGVEPILYTDRAIHPNHLPRLGASASAVRISPRMPYLAWEQGWLPRACRLDRIDLFHSPYQFGLPWLRPCPLVLTVHDAIDWALTGERRGDFRSRFHQWLARTRAHRIITISEHARNDLIHYLRLKSERIAVVPLAADARFSHAASEAEKSRVRGELGLEDPFVLYLGGWEERKNVSFLIRAFAQAQVPGLRLVLAGGRDDQRDEMKTFSRELGILDRVTLLGPVLEADLSALYQLARMFVYPSRYEGFGLQICEAMAAGCPTLAARATSLPEVLGDGGLTFGLDEPTELAILIRQVAADPALRDRLKASGTSRAGAFSWSKTAEATANVYRSVLAGH